VPQGTPSASNIYTYCLKFLSHVSLPSRKLCQFPSSQSEFQFGNLQVVLWIHEGWKSAIYALSLSAPRLSGHIMHSSMYLPVLASLLMSVGGHSSNEYFHCVAYKIINTSLILQLPWSTERIISETVTLHPLRNSNADWTSLSLSSAPDAILKARVRIKCYSIHIWSSWQEFSLR